MGQRWAAPDGREVEALSYADRPPEFAVYRRTAERGGGRNVIGYAAGVAELEALGIVLAELDQV